MRVPVNGEPVAHHAHRRGRTLGQFRGGHLARVADVHEHVVSTTLGGDAEGSAVVRDRSQTDLALVFAAEAGRVALAVEPHRPEDAP